MAGEDPCRDAIGGTGAEPMPWQFLQRSCRKRVVVWAAEGKEEGRRRWKVHHRGAASSGSILQAARNVQNVHEACSMLLSGSEAMGQG